MDKSVIGMEYGGDEYGPAMQALTEKQRRFVGIYVEFPLLSHDEVARRAGYSDHLEAAKVQASRNMHSERVLRAINEELDKRFRSDAALGRYVLAKIATNDEHPQQLKAAVALLDRGGFHGLSEHRVTVAHEDVASRLERLRDLAALLGIDTTALVGANVGGMREVKQIEHVEAKSDGE